MRMLFSGLECLRKPDIQISFYSLSTAFGQFHILRVSAEFQIYAYSSKHTKQTETCNSKSKAYGNSARKTVAVFLTQGKRDKNHMGIA